MKRIRIVHRTAYYYHEPVRFGPHRAMLRPREGHDLHIAGSRLVIEPDALLRWYRDIVGNSIAILSFSTPGRVLRIESEVDVDIYGEVPVAWAVDPSAQFYPFQYEACEQIDIVPFRVPSYPHDCETVQEWLRTLYQPGDRVETTVLLDRLNSHVHDSFQYVPRDEPGVQLPCRTLELGSGSCRDYAVLFMEAARHWGFAARFVTGYIQMPEGQHGDTHAWAEVYLPGAGWRGYDPTNNMMAGSEHVSVGVAREQEQASPLSGSWQGPDGAFDRMEVSVQVTEI